MTRHTTFRFSLDPTMVEQQLLFARPADAARFADNRSLRAVQAALTAGKVHITWESAADWVRSDQCIQPLLG
ncbi:helix-turn-helix domain-containing protein [Nocardia sp. NPDC051990]|uniref:helix-turn-helix domain-containing protein n=1 Tax=Nocardia sp. NPDC051990 TaxID=3155285 RepID=UPI003427D8AC